MDSDRSANLNEFVVNLIELVNDYSAYITQPICLEMCLWLSHLAGISAEELKNIFQKALYEYSEGVPFSHVGEKDKMSSEVEHLYAENIEMFRRLQASQKMDVLERTINDFIDQSQIPSSVKYHLLMHLLVAHVYEVDFLSEERVKHDFGKEFFLLNAVHGKKPKNNE